MSNSPQDHYSLPEPFEFVVAHPPSPDETGSTRRSKEMGSSAGNLFSISSSLAEQHEFGIPLLLHNKPNLLSVDYPFQINEDDTTLLPLFTWPQLDPSIYPPSPYDHPAHQVAVPSRLPEKIRQAPHAIGLQQTNTVKCMRDDAGDSNPGEIRRKRSASPSRPIELTQEDQMLLNLKDNKDLSWNDIQDRFQTAFGPHWNISALQMRLKTLHDRPWISQELSLKTPYDRPWNETNVSIKALFPFLQPCDFDI
ncbi:MAG: hypothetical protein Q9217_004971 [Psora testacea]